MSFDNETFISIEPMPPAKFCEKWVPVIKGKSPGDYGYRRSCCALLANLTGYKESTVSNWLIEGFQVPFLVGRYLRLLDVLLEIQILLPFSNKVSSGDDT